MSTQRYISTSFWTDKWIRSLDPSERYLYLYLLTNPQTNIAGVYQITLDRIAFDTGYDERTLQPMLERFAEHGKAHFVKEEWMIIPTWPTHQRWDARSKIKSGIENLLRELPRDVLAEAKRVGYEFPIPDDILSIPYPYESNYSDSDSDSDTDIDTDTDSGATDVAPSNTPGTDIAQPRAPAPLKDTLARYYEEAMTAVHPVEAWANIGKERGAVSTLVKKTRALLPRVPFDSEQELARAMLAAFYDARQNEKGDYWRGAPFTPSALSSRWDKIAARLAQEWQRAREWEELAGDTR